MNDKKVNIYDGSFESSLEGAHCYFKNIEKNLSEKGKVTHIIIQHGAIEYHDRHKELIDTIQNSYNKNLVISMMDLVGHGFSGGTRAYVDDFSTYVDDQLKFFKLISRYHINREVDVHLIAHSLGGMISLKTLVDQKENIPFKISSLILSNPCIKPKFSVPKILDGLMEHVSDKFSKLRLPSLYNGEDLTNDRNRALAFNHDHLNSHFLTTRMGHEIHRVSKDIMTYGYYLKTPVFFLLSGDDLIVDVEKTKLFATGVAPELVKLLYYPKEKHDLLNETCRTGIFKEIINYIKTNEWAKQCVD